MKRYHITQGALDAEERNKARAAVWNDSQTFELTMAVKEIVDLERRFGIAIDATIPDELMGKLLHHFRDEGTLLNKEDLSRV